MSSSVVASDNIRGARSSSAGRERKTGPGSRSLHVYGRNNNMTSQRSAFADYFTVWPGMRPTV